MNLREIKIRISGDLILSEENGVKKWREYFGINQVELAKEMGVSQATLSDYERNRRKPGPIFIKKFVNALVNIDLQRGGKILEELGYNTSEEYFKIGNFSSPINIKELASLIDGEIVCVKDEIERKIAGFIYLDSIGIVLHLPKSMFPWLSTHFPGRVAVFSQVSSGRTPMVVMRVVSLKPSAVIFPGLHRVDPVAKLVAEAERIPVLVTQQPLEKILENFKKI